KRAGEPRACCNPAAPSWAWSSAAIGRLMAADGRRGLAQDDDGSSRRQAHGRARQHGGVARHLVGGARRLRPRCDGLRHRLLDPRLVRDAGPLIAAPHPILPWLDTIGALPEPDGPAPSSNFLLHEVDECRAPMAPARPDRYSYVSR